MLGGVPLEQRMHELAGRGRLARAGSGLDRGDQGDARDPALRLRSRAAQKNNQMITHALDGLAVEEVDAVFEEPGDPGAVLPGIEGEIEDGLGRVDLERLDLESSEPQVTLAARLRGEADLDQRVVTQAALRRELLDQAIEGHVVVVVGLEADRTHLIQQFGERRVTRQIDAHRQGVDEQPDERLELDAVAPRGRDADHEVVLAGIAVQQRDVSRQHHHRQRQAALDAQGPQSGPLRAVEVKANGAAARAQDRRARTIAGHGQQRRRAGQLRPPPRDRLRQIAVRPRALPDRVIGVLQARVREPAIARAQGIERGQLAQQHVHRPAVEDDVMHVEPEHVLGVPEAHEPRPQQGPPLEVEGTQRLLIEACTQLCGALLRGEYGEVDVLERHRAMTRDRLERAAAGLMKGRAQHLVAGDQPVERTLERPDIERTAHAKEVRAMIGHAPGRHFMEEPQALLGRGQRHRPVPRRAGDHLIIIIPMRLIIDGRPFGPDPGRERGDRREREQLVKAELDAEDPAHPREHLGRGERVAAELEEVVMNADAIGAQHFAPDRREGGLDLRARRDQRGGPCRCGVLGGRQGAPVDLAVAGQRERRHRHDRGRDHHLGQALAQEGAQLGDPDAGRRTHHDIGDEATLPGLIFAREHDRLLDVGVAADRGFDLADLDPHPADLDLVVASTEILDRAIGAPARDISAAIQASGGVIRIWVGDEALGRQRGAVPVAAGQAQAADVQLARDADRAQVHARVEYQQSAVVDRAPDRRVRDPQVRVLRECIGGDHVALGRPVVVMQRTMWQRAKQRQHRRGQVHLLPRRRHFTQAGQHLRALAVLLRELLQHHHRQDDLLDRSRADELGEPHGVTADGLIDQVHHAAGPPGGEQLMKAGVEAQRGELEGRHAAEQRARVPFDQVDQRGVREADTLGSSGRPGCVDDVGEVLWRGHHRHTLLRVRRVLMELVEQHVRGRVHRQSLDQCTLGDEHRHGGILEDPRHARRREGRVQRHIGAPRLEDRQHADREVERSLDIQRDRDIGPHAELDEPPGDPAGSNVERAIAEALTRSGDDSGRVGGAIDLGLELGVHSHRGGELRRGRIPRCKDRAALVGGEHRQRRDRTIGGRDGGGEQHLPVIEHAPGRIFLKEVRAAAEGQRQALLRLDADLEVVTDIRRREVDRLGRQVTPQGCTRARGDRSEADLKRRAHAACGLHGVHEREGAVLRRGGDRRRGPLDQRAQAVVGAGAQAQQHGLTHGSEPGVVMRRQRDPDGELVLSGMAIQPRSGGSERDGRGICGEGGREGAKIVGEVGPRRASSQVAGERSHGRPHAVGGELEHHRGVVDLRPPPSDLRRHRLVARALAMGHVRGLLLAGPGGDRQQFSQQRGCPSLLIGDQRVHHDHQQVLAGPRAKQVHPPWWVAARVEGLACDLSRGADGRLEIFQRTYDEADRGRSLIDLLREAPASLGEGGPQQRVPARHPRDSPIEPLRVDLAAQPHAAAAVKHGRGPMQREGGPQPLLLARGRLRSGHRGHLASDCAAKPAFAASLRRASSGTTASARLSRLTRRSGRVSWACGGALSTWLYV